MTRIGRVFATAISLALAAWTPLAVARAAEAPRPTVTLAQGSLAGVAAGDLKVFKGIPYAQPVGKVGEDRLSLNVWAPAAARKAPVIVWIYGGSLTVGAPLPKPPNQNPSDQNK